MEDLEIIIPIAKNDFKALVANISYIKTHIKHKKISVIANYDLKTSIEELGLVFVDENTCIDGLSFCKVYELIKKLYPKACRRTGWYFQQFLKLGYARITECQYYLSWDSDTIPAKSLTFFDEQSNPYFDVVSYADTDASYEEFLKQIKSQKQYSKQLKYSFVTEHMVFDRSLVNEMLNDIETLDVPGHFYWQKIINLIPAKNLNLSGFSEFETYASYVCNNYPLRYKIREWHNLRNGRFYFGSSISDEIINWIKPSFDVISLEDYDKQPALLRLYILANQGKVEFQQIYQTVQPIYNAYYKLRLKIRNIIKE